MPRSPSHRPAQANKLLQVCKNLLEFARREGKWTEPNPAIDPLTGEPYLRFDLPKREVLLTPAQAKRLHAAMRAKGQFWCDFFAITGLTGRRLSNVRELCWKNIDFDSRVIVDASEEMKSDEPDLCPLVDTVLAIPKRRKKKAAEDAVYVFPGRKAGGPIMNPDHAWNEIRVAARLKHVRIHDLRHNAASWASGAGHSQATIGKFLSQKSEQSTHRAAVCVPTKSAPCAAGTVPCEEPEKAAPQQSAYSFEAELLVSVAADHLKRGHCCGSVFRRCADEPRHSEGNTKVRP